MVEAAANPIGGAAQRPQAEPEVVISSEMSQEELFKAATKIKA